MWQGRNTQMRSLLPGWISPNIPSPVPNITTEFEVPQQPQILPTFYHSLLETAKTRVKQILMCATSSPPKRACKEDWQSWPTVWYELCFKKAGSISICRGTQGKKKGPSTEISTFKNPPFLQISSLWDFLTQRISGALTQWYLEGLRLHSHHLWKFKVACIALRIQ